MLRYALAALAGGGLLLANWPLNTPSFSAGRSCHRSLKEGICIGRKHL